MNTRIIMSFTIPSLSCWTSETPGKSHMSLTEKNSFLYSNYGSVYGRPSEKNSSYCILDKFILKNIL